MCLCHSKRGPRKRASGKAAEPFCTRIIIISHMGKHKCNVYLLNKMAATPKIDLAFPALNGTETRMLLRFAKRSLVKVNAFSCTNEKKMHNFTLF